MKNNLYCKITAILSLFYYCTTNSFFIRKTIVSNNSISNMIDRLEVKPNNPKLINLSQKWQKIYVYIVLLFSFCMPKIKNRRCLFVSLLLLDWFRMKNIDPIINVGISNKRQEVAGHCWLSLMQKPFCELSTLSKNYKIVIGKTEEIIYWYN